MKDYTKELPIHIEKYIGKNDLFLEIYEGVGEQKATEKKHPLLFVHGAYTGSWMWSKYLPYFISKGWNCYVMNMRSHYKSRSMDLSEITFEDYLEDIEEVITEIGEAPIVLGFSLGGILCQKLAEKVSFAGLVLIDSCICKEVNEVAPYKSPVDNNLGLVVPAPVRNEIRSIDESEEDIAFQKKYLSMESSKAIAACGCWMKGIVGISVDSQLVKCPTLVIKALNSDEADRRGWAEAAHFNADYTGFWNTTHTGLLVGQRYMEIVTRIQEWLEKQAS